MIEFFRRIRKYLPIEYINGKYLKYASREIVLVVIGILIALQMPFWTVLFMQPVEQTSIDNQCKKKLKIKQ
jgi:hypothetical protein